MNIDLRHPIAQALAGFKGNDLKQAAISFLNTLGYRSEKVLDLENTPAAFLAQFDSRDRPLRKDKAMFDRWKSVNFLFQVTDDEIRNAGAQATLGFDSGYDARNYQSYLFFALDLEKDNYTRTQLASITREINRLFTMPAMLIMRHNGTITFSVIDRRISKRDESRDVLEKVKLIKDIRYENPHRAHIEILHDLSLPALMEKYECRDFQQLHEAWRKTLDTNELNKRFYRELADWYFWALEHVEFPADFEKDTPTRNATSVIRLLTRLIFCWFIKEKGLIPNDLFNERKLTAILKSMRPDDSSFYHAILQNMFFGTLNQRMNVGAEKNRKFAREGSLENQRDEYGVKNLYRYKDLFAIPEEEAVRLFEDIPFLNGGLFDCLDKEDESGKSKVLYVDGFSRNPRKQPKVPNFLFFSDYQTLDLSNAYGDTKRKKEKVRGLINLLDSYKFTVTENTPIEEEIALDPELLGKVFENLLASYNPETGTTARKATGSFYTPREIVNYMVDESLIAYLKGKLIKDDMKDAEKEEVERKCRQLFAYTDEPHQFTSREVEKIIDAIDAAKILDPACGSGAFPMGILHKLVFILGKLDPGNKRWKQKQIDKLDSASMREELEQAFRNNDDDFGRKLCLIENCIYGVDIQPIAIQISKLRFFISLICDQRTNKNKAQNCGVRPLPNLETKFVAANTLIALERHGFLKDPRITKLEKELAAVRHKHFAAQRRRDKLALQKSDKILRNEIAVILKAGGMSGDASRQMADWDPYDQNASAGFFDPEWMFGVRDGFDVVIGNPPYGPLNKRQNKSEAISVEPWQLEYYKSSSVYALAQGGMLNVFRLFVLKSINLLREGGSFSEIFPLAFVGDSSAAGLRRYVLENTSVDFIEAFPERDDPNRRVFEASKMSVCVLNLSRKQPEKRKFFLRIHSNRFIDPAVQKAMLDSHDIRLLDRSHLTIPLVRQCDLTLLLKVYAACARVEDIGHCYTGEVDMTFGKPYMSTNPRDVPLLRGAIIDRYTTRQQMSQGEILFLRAKKYLAKVGGAKSSHVKSERIAMQGITGVNEKTRLKMTLIPEGVFCANSVNYIVLNDRRYDMRFLLGVLNSRLLNYVFSKFSTNSNVNGYEVDNLPIPRQTDEAQKESIGSMVNKVLVAKKADPAADVSALESEIDQMVYKLYGLTEEEIKIVEGKIEHAE